MVFIFLEEIGFFRFYGVLTWDIGFVYRESIYIRLVLWRFRVVFLILVDRWDFIWGNRLVGLEERFFNMGFCLCYTFVSSYVSGVSNRFYINRYIIRRLREIFNKKDRIRVRI